MQTQTEREISFEEFRKSVLHDYKLALLSRNISLIGRREVLNGKAKFGIFGDGKELPQIAMARVFRKGDFRAGYYRDQTFMMAIGVLTAQQFFASLYADADLEREPSSGGRQMSNHFATPALQPDGSWSNLMEQKNSSVDCSCIAAQMPRLVGLAEASRLYRELEALRGFKTFSQGGNEVAFGTIGDAGTSEGLFWEAVNAAGVLQIPIVLSVWDDDYGISVPKTHQTTKGSISEVLRGFQRQTHTKGWEILRVKGWDYPALIETYQKAERLARREHLPVLVHVEELTQPQGHSTSGSHERYKSPERLEWEKRHDCISRMRKWISDFEIEADAPHCLAEEEALQALESEAEEEAKQARRAAWEAFLEPIQRAKETAYKHLRTLYQESDRKVRLKPLILKLRDAQSPRKKDVLSAARQSLHLTRGEALDSRSALRRWVADYTAQQNQCYSDKLYSESPQSHRHIPPLAPQYDSDAPEVDGRIVLRDNFDRLFAQYPELLTFGQDSGLLGDVNQGLEGLQQKYGALRIADAGICEATIVGRGIGLALRGLRPIAEIQYLDYLSYAYSTLSDDLATLHYRSGGRQKAPVIIRTRGHRLEGIWHSGSPMGALLNACRGIYLLTPRNMTQAAGFYNTLLECDNPAIVIEGLKHYRLKEKLPNNLGAFKTPIGKVEFLRRGSDVTLVTYGFMCDIAGCAAQKLADFGIQVELIDAQSLLPFDEAHEVVESLKKTNRLVVADEDVPGGCSAYLMREILETQKGYRYLDSPPCTLTARAHRPAYGSDGDYFSKPSEDDLLEKIYALMHEAHPKAFPLLF